jgi:hypothetical protein
MASDERDLVSSTLTSVATTGAAAEAAATGVSEAEAAGAAATSVLVDFFDEVFLTSTGAEAAGATTEAAAEAELEAVCLVLVVRTILSSGRVYTLY